MNDEAIKDAFGLFVQTGYKGSIEDFTKLINENPEARKDAFGLFTQTGYKGSQEDFDGLMGIGSLKKKSSSESITETGSTDSQLGIGISGSPVSVRTDDIIPTEETRAVTRKPKLTEEEATIEEAFGTFDPSGSREKTVSDVANMRGALGSFAQQESEAMKLWNGYRDGSIPEPKKPRVSTPAIAFGVPQSVTSNVEKLKNEKRQREYELQMEIFNAKSADEVQNIIMKRNEQDLNNAYWESSDIADVDRQTKPFISVDENGNYAFNDSELGKSLTQIKALEDYEQGKIIEETINLMGYKMSIGGEATYSMMTGVMNIGAQFQGIWDEEGSQWEQYQNSFRTQAALANMGLTPEQRSKGVIENATDGDFSAALANMYVMTLEQLPQIAAQAAVATASGGTANLLGLGAKASAMTSRVAGAAFMGGMTYGGTMAQTFGHMSDSERYTLAIGNAIIETVSEYALPSEFMGSLDNAQINGLRNAIFNKGYKGIVSKDFAKLAKAHGVDMLRSGGEEFLEELIAGAGSSILNAAVTGEDINVFEIIDGAIIGATSGATSGGVRATKGLLSGGINALGYGGLRLEKQTYKLTRQKLQEQLAVERNQLKAQAIKDKIAEVDKLMAQVAIEQDEVYKNYSDEDATETLSLNQQLNNLFLKRSQAQTQEEKEGIETEAKETYAKIQAIESKYETQRQDIRAQNEAIGSWVEEARQSGQESFEVGADFDTKGIKIFDSIKNVATSLAKSGTKVFVHATPRSAAKKAGISIKEAKSMSGVYVDQTGSIHIYAPQVQNNTAFHEAFHKIARGLDRNYMKRFVEASLLGMDAQMSEKYRAIMSQNKDNKALAYEEAFAEIAADIADGTITMEKSGTSIARAVGSVIRNTLGAAGIKVSDVTSFNQFADFMKSATESLQAGTEVESVQGTASKKNEVPLGAMFQATPSKRDLVGTKAQIRESKLDYTEKTFLDVNDTGERQGVVLDMKPRNSPYEKIAQEYAEDYESAKDIYELQIGELAVEIADTYSVMNNGKEMSIGDSMAIATIMHRNAAEQLKKTPLFQPAKGQFLKELGITEAQANNAKKATHSPRGFSRSNTLINEKTPMTNLFTEIEKFYYENGRFPKVYFWMGDQSGRGYFMTSDGTKIELEGGVSFAADEKNAKDGIVWASHKSDANLTGMMKDADFVCICSGAPESGHFFYKGTTRAIATELMEGLNRNLGKEYNIGSAKTPKMLQIPNEKFKDPLDALRWIGEQYMILDKATADVKEFMSGIAKLPIGSTLEDYLAQDGQKVIGVNKKKDSDDESATTRMAIPRWLFNTKADKTHSNNMAALFKFLGMPTMNEFMDKFHDSFLTENEYGWGDVYAIMSIDRRAGVVAKQGAGEGNEIVMTSEDGRHGTYGNSIHGKLLGVTNRKDNIYDIADPLVLLKNADLSGIQKIRLLADKNSFIYEEVNTEFSIPISEEELNELNALNNELLPEFGEEWDRLNAPATVLKKTDAQKAIDKARVKEITDHNAPIKKRKGEVIKEAFKYLKKALTTEEYDSIIERIEKLYDIDDMFNFTDVKRILADAGVDYMGEILAINIAEGRTRESAQQMMKEAAEAIREEALLESNELLSNKHTTIFAKKGALQMIKGLFKTQSKIAKLYNEETNRRVKALYQSASTANLGQQILLGVKKAEIIAQLRTRGVSRSDAEMLYKQAKAYAQGGVAGYRAGIQNKSAELSAKRKEERKNESEKAKELRNEMRNIYKSEKGITKEVIDRLISLVEEYSGSAVKAATVKQLLRLAQRASRVSKMEKGKYVMSFPVFNSIVDKAVAIMEKEQSAEDLREYVKLLKETESMQRELLKKYNAIKKSSKNPMISYSEQIQKLTSLDATILTEESLDILNQALKDLFNTAKQVTVRKGEISRPYVEVEGFGQLDTRRAKIFFNNIYDELFTEQQDRQQAQDIDASMDLAFQNGTNWYDEYQNILKERIVKDMKGVQKKLQEIADDMGLDLSNIEDFETAMELLQEEKGEDFDKQKSTLIETIVPVFNNWKQYLSMHPDFVEIFDIDLDLDADTQEALVRERLDRLNGFELKRLEFYMFDYAVNGTTFGINTLSAAVVAKNDGIDALKKLNIRSREKAGTAAGAYIFNKFGNTQTLFRQILLGNSQVAIAKFKSIIGYSSLSSDISRADRNAALFVERVTNKAKELGLTGISDQLRMQLYSVLTQKPEGKMSSQHLLQTINSFVTALATDKRFDKEQKAQMEEAFNGLIYDNGKKRDYDDIIAELEADDKLMDMISFLRGEFTMREGALQQYAENFLGVQFQSVQNYLPIRMRVVGSADSQLVDDLDKMKSIQKAMRSFGLTRATGAASSTYARDEHGIDSDNYHIDLSFFGSMANTYKENEVKINSSKSIAYISQMTSEKNEEFVKSVPNAEWRRQIRKMTYNFIMDGGVGKTSGDLLGAEISKKLARVSDVTSLYYFGSAAIQLIKQSSAIGNAMIEGHLNILQLLSNFADVVTGKLDQNKVDLMDKFDIGIRDVISETINAASARDAIINNKGQFERGKELSLKGMRISDKAAAQASWLSYYESYLRKENLVDGDIDWANESANPNSVAAQYASQMVVKDQNISTSRERAQFANMTQGKIDGIMKMIVMPFANFLLNKKLNLMLDYQELRLGGDKKGTARSIAGTALEIAMFHTLSEFFLKPLLISLSEGIFGDDEDEESLFDEQFSLRLWMKGMATDMNPLVMPIGFIENVYAKGINLIAFLADKDASDWNFEDKGFWDGFSAWSKANGLPEFGGVGRGETGIPAYLRSFGVIGDVVTELYTSSSNLITLAGKNPSYITSSGKEKFLSPDDAKNVMKVEALKFAMVLQSAFTGLFAKESVVMAKEYAKDIQKRSVSSENENIGRMLQSEEFTGRGEQLLDEKVTKLEKDNPLAIEGTINTITGQHTVKHGILEGISKKYINTIKQIDQMTYEDPRYAALYARDIMKKMNYIEKREFNDAMHEYFIATKENRGMIYFNIILGELENRENE